MKVYINKGMKKSKKIIGVLVASIILTSCQSPVDEDIAEDNNANEITNNIPLLDEYDYGMSKADFITAPKVVYDSSENTQYVASYNMTVENTEADFVLGDENGEYGQLILCGISEGADEDRFILKVFEDGKEVSFSDYHQEIPFTNSEDHVFDVSLEVQHADKDQGQYSLLKVNINGEDIGSLNIPTFSLGCVGSYKTRGTTKAYIDDILVMDGDNILFEEDFDGNYINNLYEYDYDPDQGPSSAFSPNYIKTTSISEDNSMIVSSGFVLSDTRKDSTPVFKKNFDIADKDIKSAYVYMTALGSFDIELNGRKVSDYFFEPGKMVYNKYLNYVSYDITDKITENNEILIYLFHGFYDRGVGYPEAMNSWGQNLALKGEVVINYADGTTDIIPTDDSFLVSRDSRYRSNDVYQGEIIDDRYDLTEDAKWDKAIIAGSDLIGDSILNAEIRHKENESIAATKEVSPVNISQPYEECYVYDFGVNIAGTLELYLDEEILSEYNEGHVITVRYGELLNSDDMVNSDGIEGTVWTQNLLTAKNTDQYIVGDIEQYSESSKEICFSHTYHGFRYVEITGLSKELSLDSIKAISLSSDMEVTGEFESDNEIVNRFFQNSSSSLTANMMDVPTDCPQRDERLSWTGDAQVVSAFAMYMYNADAFYKNYLLALRSQQGENGFMDDVAITKSQGFGGHSCWGDALVAIMWNHYLQYADTKVLEDNIDAACLWVDYLESISEDYLVCTDGYGDHCSQQGTDMTLSDTAWSAHSARLVSKMCQKLGYEERADKYSKLADNFKAKWQETYIRSDYSVEAGIIYSEYESETAYALGIEFDLFPEEMMADAAARLKVLTEYGGYRFYPGYSGMEFYLMALCDYGYVDTAINVLSCTELGGLAYPLSMGLVSNPEELNCFRYEDASGVPYGDGKYIVSGSLNHMAYSSVCEVYFKNLLGIKADENAPGYEHFFLKPCVSESLGQVSGLYRCRFGDIKVSWNCSDHMLTCSIPENTTCTLTLPDGSTTELTAGDYEYTWN